MPRNRHWRTGWVAAVLSLLAGVTPVLGQTFESRQRAYDRVEAAFGNQLDRLGEQFAARGVEFPPTEVFFRVIKNERVLELWARRGTETPFQSIATYPICAMSGDLGPKRREGDLQHPEGIYNIARWNHRSSYHLSLGFDYPNASDAILADPQAPGSDIFIHGRCGSHGCLAMTDDVVEALYVVAVIARSSGQRRIPVHVFPIRFTAEGIAGLREHPAAAQHWDFWMSLVPLYEYFEVNRELPEVVIDDEGRYHLVVL